MINCFQSKQTSLDDTNEWKELVKGQVMKMRNEWISVSSWYSFELIFSSQTAAPPRWTKTKSIRRKAIENLMATSDNWVLSSHMPFQNSTVNSNDSSFNPNRNSTKSMPFILNIQFLNLNYVLRHSLICSRLVANDCVTLHSVPATMCGNFVFLPSW